MLGRRPLARRVSKIANGGGGVDPKLKRRTTSAARRGTQPKQLGEGEETKVEKQQPTDPVLAEVGLRASIAYSLDHIVLLGRRPLRSGPRGRVERRRIKREKPRVSQSPLY